MLPLPLPLLLLLLLLLLLQRLLTTLFTLAPLQVYIPEMNWFLMIGAVVVVAIFPSSASIGNAYGDCCAA